MLHMIIDKRAAVNELFLFRRDTRHCGIYRANNGNQCRPVILPSRRNERRRFRKQPAHHKSSPREAQPRARVLTSHTRDDNGRFVRDLAFTDCQSGLRDRDKESPRITNNSRSRVILDLAWEITEYFPRIYSTRGKMYITTLSVIIMLKDIFNQNLLEKYMCKKQKYFKIKLISEKNKQLDFPFFYKFGYVIINTNI